MRDNSPGFEIIDNAEGCIYVSFEDTKEFVFAYYECGTNNVSYSNLQICRNILWKIKISASYSQIHSFRSTFSFAWFCSRCRPSVIDQRTRFGERFGIHSGHTCWDVQSDVNGCGSTKQR